MTRVEYIESIVELFNFKTILDEHGNEYVLFANSLCETVHNVIDKTEFEAYENHVHIVDNVKKSEFEHLVGVSRKLGKVLLDSLKLHYPNRQFVVYVSIHLHDSMIIRFHQKWENEEPYLCPEDFQLKDEKVFAFET